METEIGRDLKVNKRLSSPRPHHGRGSTVESRAPQAAVSRQLF